MYFQVEGAVTARHSGRVWPANGGTTLRIDCSDYLFYIVVVLVFGENGVSQQFRVIPCNPSIAVPLRFLLGLLFVLSSKIPTASGHTYKWYFRASSALVGGGRHPASSPLGCQRTFKNQEGIKTGESIVHLLCTVPHHLRHIHQRYKQTERRPIGPRLADM